VALVTNKQALVIAAGLAVGGYLLYRNRQLFNPASRDNVAYWGVNQFGQELADDEAWTLGGWIYDLYHPHQDWELNPEQAPMWWKLQNPQYLN